MAELASHRGGVVRGATATVAGSTEERSEELRLDELRALLRSMAPVVVAFSGGADSAFLARVATMAVGPERVLCATAVSPSLAAAELADCRALAREWQLQAVEVETDELADPAYATNDGERCFHCKTSLMEALAPLAERLGGNQPAQIVLGVNLDDLGDHRPGQRAAAELGARFPLVEAGFTKAAVRSCSRRLGLRTWDKPAAACLASRIPYGTPVTLGTLRSVADAEAGLRSLGFRDLRVRHYGDTARIEVTPDDLAAAVTRRHEVTAVVHAAGYRYVTLDLDGLRSGNLNAALVTSASTPGSEAAVAIAAAGTAGTADAASARSEVVR
jgi:pyridinium-3,5-biscarboxylic acid mononucleotide sulfurtransferase